MMQERVTEAVAAGQGNDAAMKEVEAEASQMLHFQNQFKAARRAAAAQSQSSPSVDDAPSPFDFLNAGDDTLLPSAAVGDDGSSSSRPAALRRSATTLDAVAYRAGDSSLGLSQRAAANGSRAPAAASRQASVVQLGKACVYTQVDDETVAALAAAAPAKGPTALHGKSASRRVPLANVPAMSKRSLSFFHVHGPEPKRALRVHSN